MITRIQKRLKRSKSKNHNTKDLLSLCIHFTTQSDNNSLIYNQKIKNINNSNEDFLFFL